MKKFKVLLLTIGMVLALCSCGGRDEGQRAGADTTTAKTEVTPVPVKEATPEPIAEPTPEQTPEPTPEPTPVPLIEGDVVCLPEMQFMNPEDWAMQVGYSVIKMDGSMSFGEIILALRDSGLGLEFVDRSSDEYDVEVRSYSQWNDEDEVDVCKDGVRVMRLEGVNTSGDIIAGTDERMKLQSFVLLEKNIAEYVYFCKGIPMTGEGWTYGMVMEAFSEYVPVMTSEIAADKTTLLVSFDFNSVKEDGSMKKGFMRFAFASAEDASPCMGVSLREYEE